jgi:predicted dehydrogenase
MLGYGFMGKAHSNALRTMTYIDWPGVVRPELLAIAGRTNERVADAAVRYGFDGYYTDWHGLVEDERLSVFDNAAADEAHLQPTLAADTCRHSRRQARRLREAPGTPRR